jgi:hypothetical protein
MHCSRILNFFSSISMSLKLSHLSKKNQTGVSKLGSKPSSLDIDSFQVGSSQSSSSDGDEGQDDDNDEDWPVLTWSQSDYEGDDESSSVGSKSEDGEEEEEVLNEMADEERIEAELAAEAIESSEDSELEFEEEKERSKRKMDFMKRGEKVKSKITGKYKFQWEEEIEAGYGSESSTEEVSSAREIMSCARAIVSSCGKKR